MPMDAQTYADYYDQQRRESNDYEQFVAEGLRVRGYNIMRCLDEQSQKKWGDAIVTWKDGRRESIEFKHDKYFGVKSRRFWIEVSERGRNITAALIEGGIWSPASWRWFLIGNYEIAFLFERSVLQTLDMDGKHERRLNNLESGEGFFLYEDEARRLAKRIINWNERPHVD